MNFRRTPSSHDRDAYRHEVVDALEKTGLEPGVTLVIGGAALALAGLRQAHDLDLKVPHFVYGQLAQERQTPSGLILWNKPAALRPFLETTPVHLPPDMMHVDITHPHDRIHHHGSPELDDEFLDTIDGYDKVAGFPVLPLELVAEHKERPESLNTRKNRKDLKLIKAYLADKQS